MLNSMMPNKVSRAKKLRGYQQEFDDAVSRAFREFKRVLAVLPTGGGKTLCSGEQIARFIEGGGRVLMLAHTRKLVFQFRDKMEHDYGIHTSIEAGDRAADESPLVCATVQTMSSRIAGKKFKPDSFGLIVIDEAHRALAPGYLKIEKFFTEARFLGITATPKRSDQRNLMRFFETKAIDVPMSRLISEGHLSPLTIVNFPVTIRLEKTGSGDYSEADVAHAIEPYLESCADELKKRAAGRASLVFLPLIDTSLKFTDMLRRIGVRAAHLDGGMSGRQIDMTIKQLEMGQIDVICNSMLLTEGVDIRCVSCVMNLRATESWGLYTQIIGRGTRTFDPAADGPDGTAWGKKANCLILDPLWQCDKHSLLQRPSCLLATSEEEADEMDGIISEGAALGMEIDLMEAKNKAAHNREERLAKRLEGLASRKERSVNAMDFFLKTGQGSLIDYEAVSPWESQRMTEGQMAMLSNNGFDLDSVTDRGHASKIIEHLVERSKRGYASPRACKYAVSLGMGDAYTRSRDEVSRFIERKKSNPLHDPYSKIPD